MTGKGSKALRVMGAGRNGKIGKELPQRESHGFW